ncbi:DUF5313 family protein [Kutzneria sp. CA-103260]|uniref:DUF5313 family protein n=1 Tax=Kutzneria sp. CA-103260 TaxID=2802641 RepID=UPI001BA8DAB2|nr:DUF5313 family protein [Kutzneria sp. CA-103260]QUQ64416.1 hypothetical protein JJ691_21360 [Kutzneria sp. CA-103260]
MVTHRPNPLRWLHYVYGGRLPERYREWVLYDATCRTWLLRYAVKVAVEALPLLVAAYLVLTVLTPAPASMVLPALAVGLLMSLYFVLTSAEELTEARLTKHGYSPGTGRVVRRRRIEASRRR